MLADYLQVKLNEKGQQKEVAVYHHLQEQPCFKMQGLYVGGQQREVNVQHKIPQCQNIHILKEANIACHSSSLISVYTLFTIVFVHSREFQTQVGIPVYTRSKHWIRIPPYTSCTTRFAIISQGRNPPL